MNSSTKDKPRTLALISAKQAKTFLVALANLRDEDAALWFRRHYGRIFLPEMPISLIQHWAVRGEEEDIGDLSEDQKQWKYWLLPLRDAVRRLWISDERDKRWGTFRILEKYFLLGSRRFTEGPVKDDGEWFLPADLGPETICERIFTHMSGPTTRCHNPDCPHAPYFFATRRSQKYCSDECAIPAQREFKRKWWRENGARWRARRPEHKGRKGTRRSSGRARPRSLTNLH
jgi:hypothetical protein